MKQTILGLTFFCLAIGFTNPVFGTPPNTWVQTSDGLTAANNVYSFAFSPNYASDNTVFAASSNVFKSTDGGLTWLPTQLNMEAGSLAFSSNRILMAATSQGVYATNNDGAQWTRISNLPNPWQIEVVAFSPNYAIDHTIFAGTFSSGLWNAVWDGNLLSSPTWTQVGTIPASGKVTRLVFSPNFLADQIVFAGVPIATGTGRGIYKSTNGGVTWRAITSNNWNPTKTLTIQSLAISPNFQNDGTLFTSLFPGVYKSVDGGESWNMLPGGDSMNLPALAISPKYAVDGTVFGAGTLCEGACLTTNGGKSWRLLNAGFPPELGMNIRTLAIPPNQTNQPFNVFSGNASGVATTLPVWQMLYQNWWLFLPLILR